MTDRSLEQARIWLRKAESDLATARILIEGPEKHLDTGVYHCQQTAEKSIKAWLAAREVVFPKTHILEVLLDLCVPMEPGFENLRSFAEELTPLATEFRYPGDVFEPEFDQAEHLLTLARKFLQFVSDRSVWD